MPITTADCTAFLADFIAANPSIVTSIYAPETISCLTADATNPKRWKRTHKCKPGGGDYCFDHYEIFDRSVPVSRIGYDGTRTVPAKNFVVERGFVLHSAIYDTGVAFVVLEDADGNLHLGDYIGD